MKLNIENLTKENFSDYGFFTDLIKPESNCFGDAPVEFYPDIIQMYFPTSVASMSSVVVYPRAFIVDGTEYHGSTCEATLPIDGDILIHVAVPSKGEIPYGKIRIFRVPKGTMVILKPGVWHGAPFTTGNTPRSALVILSERAYANDCVFLEIPEERRPEINTEGLA